MEQINEEVGINLSAEDWYWNLTFVDPLPDTYGVDSLLRFGWGDDLHTYVIIEMSDDRRTIKARPIL